jgi:hypothetical protein
MQRQLDALLIRDSHDDLRQHAAEVRSRVADRAAGWVHGDFAAKLHEPLSFRPDSRAHCDKKSDVGHCFDPCGEATMLHSSAPPDLE